MKLTKQSRRMFLQGVGTSLPIPFLASMLPRTVWAQTAEIPRRFISILSNYDIGRNGAWFPRMSSHSMNNLPPPSQVHVVGGSHHNIYHQALRDFVPTNSSNLSMVAGTALSPFVESINILRGLDFIFRYGHDNSQVLGGLPSSSDTRGKLKLIPTIDHFLNNHKSFNPKGLPINFWGPAGHIESWSYAATADTATKAASSYYISGIYNALFSNGTFPEAGESAKPHPKMDVLSRVLEDYKRVRNSRNISSDDKLVLDNAVDKWSDVQKGLLQSTTASCKHKSLVKMGNVASANESAAVGKVVADMITAAILCDTGRVFTIGTGPIGGLFDGENFEHGTTSHQPFSLVNGKYQWQRMAERQNGVIRHILAPLVQNLSSVIDPSNGKSFLYNSLIMNSYENGQVHGYLSHPVMLIGNAGGKINSGQYIDYGDKSKPANGADEFTSTLGSENFSNNYQGVLYNRLLVTILQAMGLSAADYEDNSLESQVYGRSDLGAMNVNLSNLGGYGYVTRGDLSIVGNYTIDQSLKKGLPKYRLSTFKDPLPLLLRN